MSAFRPSCECGCRKFFIAFDEDDIDLVCVSCGGIPDYANPIVREFAASLVRAAKASAKRDIRSQSLHAEVHAQAPK